MEGEGDSGREGGRKMVEGIRGTEARLVARLVADTCVAMPEAAGLSGLFV